MSATAARLLADVLNCTTVDELHAINPYRAWNNGHITEEEVYDIDAERTARLEALRRPRAPVWQRPSVKLPSKTSQRRRPRSPDRQRSIERRRSVAGSNWLPPAIRWKFTEGERAVLSIIARENQQHGCCTLCVDAIAAQSGTSPSTVNRAMRAAETQQLLTRLQRPRTGMKHDTNVVTISSKEWRSWIASRFIPLGTKRGSPRSAGLNSKPEQRFILDQQDENRSAAHAAPA
jgi:DNA-binding MarR family transcriptional regulator